MAGSSDFMRKVELANVSSIYVHLNYVLGRRFCDHHLLNSVETFYTLKLNFLATLGFFPLKKELKKLRG